MSKKTTVVKTPSVTELMEGVRAPIKQWSGAEFAAGNSQAIANTLAAPIIATLMAANVTCLCKPTTPTGKKRAKLVSDAIISGLTKIAQDDIIFVRSFSGGKGNNSWKTAAPNAQTRFCDPACTVGFVPPLAQLFRCWEMNWTALAVVFT